VPEVSEILEHFNFIPNWRLDDIMISYAPEGGSVGPHFDNYDVFLLQAEGERRWQLGPMCDSDTPRLKHPDLRILETMDVTQEWILAPGDMLYLPPRYAHFGVAENDCMTYSIGFRAPSVGDIAANFGDYLANNLPDENRYEDADLAPQKNPGEISEHTLNKLKQTIHSIFDNPEHLARWFGEYMTTPKYPNPPEDEIPTYTEEMWLEEFRQCIAVRKEEDARFAYRLNKDGVLFFANGISLPCELNLLPLIELLCKHHEWTQAELNDYVSEPHNLLLLATLMSINSLYFI
jgi:50S ribosomal protein L16 3-hydroxylase